MTSGYVLIGHVEQGPTLDYLLRKRKRKSLHVQDYTERKYLADIPLIEHPSELLFPL